MNNSYFESSQNMSRYKARMLARQADKELDKLKNRVRILQEIEEKNRRKVKLTKKSINCTINARLNQPMHSAATPNSFHLPPATPHNHSQLFSSKQAILKSRHISASLIRSESIKSLHKIQKNRHSVLLQNQDKYAKVWKYELGQKRSLEEYRVRRRAESKVKMEEEVRRGIRHAEKVNEMIRGLELLEKEALGRIQMTSGIERELCLELRELRQMSTEELARRSLRKSKLRA